MGPTVSDNKKWQQEDDAHVLAQAELIKADPARLRGASTAAKRMLADKQKQIVTLSKVANPQYQKKAQTSTPKKTQIRPKK
jgi:hypothetical protein